MHRGSCLCSAVTFEVEGALPGPDACHCGQCRKTSGHYFASTDVPRSAVTINGQDQVTWFRSSEKVRRGFCRTCGASLFWEPLEADWIGIAMGAFDTPTETHIAMHIYVDNKGDYYDIADAVRQFEQAPPPPG